MQMQTYIAHIRICFHPWVPDSTERASRDLGLSGLKIIGVSDGKYLKVELKAEHHPAACNEVEAICREFLANPIIETYDYTVVQKAGS
jgi:phosphoribosylformylglycinamidine (FGAM) synthase PurS component